jgi:hypothetical protein
MLQAVAVAIAAVVSSAPQVPADVIRDQAERELALVRHLHRHVLEPSDGLALAADRRDLQRRGPGAPSGATLSPGASEVELLGELTILTDLWYARVIGRTPFQQMPRERLAQLSGAQRAVGELRSRADPKGHDTFLPDVQAELETLVRLTSTHADISEADIDLAIAIADQAAAGRPLSAYGMRPTGAPYGATPSGTSPASAPAPPPGATPPPPPDQPSTPPSPSSSSPAPYTLPPGYANYAPPTAASATSSPNGCQVLRLSAGTSSSSAGMLRAVECWTALQSWPGWVAQVVESLDWAETYAKVDRDCAALGEVLDRAKSFGRPLAPGVKPEDVAAVSERAESSRRMLRAANKCR